MPNGLNLSIESDDWCRLESPLLEIDSRLESLAGLHGMHITRNHHNWPSRILGWSSSGLSRGIGIVLDDPNEGTYNVGAYTSKGSGMSWLSGLAQRRFLSLRSAKLSRVGMAAWRNRCVASAEGLGEADDFIFQVTPL